MSHSPSRQDAGRPTSPHRSFVRLLAVAALALSLAAAPRTARAFDPAGWAYVRLVEVDNSGQAAPLAAYPIHVVLQSPAFDFAQARADGGDLRFLNANQDLLPYWIESWDPVGGHASVWVKADLLPAGIVTTLTMYHGNPAATSVADPHATFPFYDGFESKNAPAPLVTPTYDGTGQAMHPSVVHVPGGWNGYEYWMGMTPYPNDQDNHENPSVLASHDGLTWVVPAGLTNPIAGQFSGGYHNDTELVLSGSTMVLYYLQTFTAGTTNLRRTTSTNGSTWTTPTTVMTFPNYVMSPTILIENGVWKMWYAASVGGCYSTEQDILLRTSADGITWGAPVTNTFTGAGVVPWHLEVRKDGAKYVMLVASYDPSSNCEHTDLWYADSDDGTAWTFAPRPIIARTGGGWDNLEIYRAAFLIDQGVMRIWYSASSTSHVWGTAYVTGTLTDFLAASAAPWDDSQGNMSNVTSPVRSGTYALRQVGSSSSYPMIIKSTTGKFAVAAWTYDTVDQTAEHAASLRVWDPGTAQMPLHCVGVGYMTDVSQTKYVSMTENWNYSLTGLNRTAGWHLLGAQVAASTCHLSIDGGVVASYSVLDENNITQFSIEGDAAGTSWFDDVYLRPYSEPEPVVTVHPVIPTTGVDGPGAGAGALRIDAVRPNPAMGRATVAFTLPRAGRAVVRVLAVSGAVVRTLADGPLAAGPHALAWDGTDATGARAASGVYFVQVESAGAATGRRVVLLR